MLDSCLSIDTTGFETVFGEMVVVRSSVPPVSAYRSCIIHSAADPTIQLGTVDVAPDLGGERYRFDFLDTDNLAPLDAYGGNSGWGDGLFTYVRVEEAGAEVIVQGVQWDGGGKTLASFDHVDANQLAALVPGIVRDMQGGVTRDLPVNLQTCDDIPFSEVAGQSLGGWTAAAFDGMLHCITEAADGSRVSLAVGGLEDTDAAVEWVNRTTDWSLEGDLFDLAYPLAWRGDNIDRGFGSFGVTVFHDFSRPLDFSGEDEPLQADMAVGSHGRWVAWLSVTGGLSESEVLDTSIMAELLDSVFAGTESDYDPALRDENPDRVAAEFFAENELSLADVPVDRSACTAIDLERVLSIAPLGQLVLGDFPGLLGLEREGDVLACNFNRTSADGFARTPLDVEVWNGEGDWPWADWQTDFYDSVDSPTGVLSLAGPDLDITGVLFEDDSGRAIKVEADNRRLNPVTLSEILQVLDVVVTDMS